MITSSHYFQYKVYPGFEDHILLFAEAPIATGRTHHVPDNTWNEEVLDERPRFDVGNQPVTNGK